MRGTNEDGLTGSLFGCGSAEKARESGVSIDCYHSLAKLCLLYFFSSGTVSFRINGISSTDICESHFSHSHFLQNHHQVIVNSCSDTVPGLLHACVCDFDACNLSK